MLKMIIHLSLLLLLMLDTQSKATKPDVTGLLGIPYYRHKRRPLEPSSVPKTLPLTLWNNSRRSVRKPRRRNLKEDVLLGLMKDSYDPKWMRYTEPPSEEIKNDDENRLTVQLFRKTVKELGLASNLSSFIQDATKGDSSNQQGLSNEIISLVDAWLVKRATCPIRFVWDDLGPYFWPRWIRRGECISNKGRNITMSESCSWPPGMSCVTGVARKLEILRWHCKLRKSARNWLLERPRNMTAKRKDMFHKLKRRYRCFWIKVPYPVPEDCVCSV